MSAISSPTTSPDSEPRQRPAFTFQRPIRNTPKLNNNHKGSVITLAPRPRIPRHYTTLQEHADFVRENELTPRRGDSTSRAEDRREGFTWEVSKDEDLLCENQRSALTPITPPSMKEILQTKATEYKEAVHSVTSIKSANSNDSGPGRSATSQSDISYPAGISRTDTGRSSFSGFARGVMKHMPDMRMFMPVEKEADLGEDTGRRPVRKKSKTASHPRFDFCGIAPIELPEMKPKHAQTSAHRSNPDSKGTIQDRRKVAIGNTMKLTLPQDMPQLPSRGRMPASELSSIVPSRPRSPKTPSISNHPPAWYIASPLTAPPTILEDADMSASRILPGDDTIFSLTIPRAETSNNRPRTRPSLNRVRFGRPRSSGRGTSTDDSQTASPNAFPKDSQLGQQSQLRVEEQNAQIQIDLQELGKRSRPCRWLRNGRWSSNDLIDTTPPSSSDRAGFSMPLLRFLKTKRSIDSTSSVSNKSTTPKCFWRRKQSISTRPSTERQTADFFDNMAVPPDFIPPGLSRVPTPPVYDANGEVKGKLNDFFFGMRSTGRAHGKTVTPASIWDSDALLMSQTTKISLLSTDSNESPPQGPLASGTTPRLANAGEDTTSNMTICTPTPGLATYFNEPLGTASATASTPGIPSPSKAPTEAKSSNWFRVETPTGQQVKDDRLRWAEEKAKLEWITPEHLPNSPLCPLHPKYRGPSMGTCVFHRMKKAGAAAAGGARMGDAGAGSDEGGEDESLPRRQSRLKTTRRESIFDGAEEAGGSLRGYVFTRSRRIRRNRVSSP